MFRVPRHLWRTADGRLVENGDPAAAFLAYPAGTDLNDDVAQREGLLLAVKARRTHHDKARARAADKAAGVDTETKEDSDG